MREARQKTRLEYFIACVSEFARATKLSSPDAFDYLHRNGGIDFLVKCYEAEHTLSYDDAIADLMTVCRKNGGRL